MRFVSLLAGLFLAMGFASAAEAKRIALVIANGNYASASELKNPPADARLIASSLRQAGFDEVTVMVDLGKTKLESELRNFGTRAEGAEVALVYYAGHGIEAGGQNYLIPVDARLERDRDLEIEATRLDTLLLMTEGARKRIIVLDACRNNPFTASMQRTFASRSVGRGLAAVEPAGETLVVYAAKAGATAADGEGANSPFAEALAKRLPQPGLEISLLFRAVRDDVLAKTGRVQEPFTYGSLSGEAFYFKPGQQQATSAQGTATVSVSSEATEILFWQGALSANSERAYRDYLSRYPQGMFAGLAEENLARFVKPAVPNVTTGAGRPGPNPPAAARPVRAQPSYSCNGKLNRVERMICDAPTLATADRSFSEKFMGKYGALEGSSRMGLVRWAAENRRERDKCPTQGCVLDWYAKMGKGLSAF